MDEGGLGQQNLLRLLQLIAALQLLKLCRVTAPASCRTRLLCMELRIHSRRMQFGEMIVMERRGLWCVFRPAGFERTTWLLFSVLFPRFYCGQDIILLLFKSELGDILSGLGLL